MFHVFFLNAAVLILEIRAQSRIAHALIFAAGLFAVWSLNRYGLTLHTTGLLAEGVLGSLFLLLCLRGSVKPGLYYLLGMLPAALVLLIALVFHGLRESLGAEISQILQQQMDLSANLHLYAATAQETEYFVKTLVRIYPSLWILSGLFRIWLVRNLVLFIFRKRNTGLGKITFTDLQLPDTILWTFIAGLALILFSMTRTAGANLLIFTSVLYTLQGFAVIQKMFAVHQTPSVLVVVFYTLTLILQIPVFAVSTVGILDTWIGFRKRFKKSIPQEK